MEPITKLALRGRLHPVSDTRNCTVLRGSAIDANNRQIGVFAKYGTPLQLFADLVCSRLCRSLDLPSPKPYLIAVHRSAVAWPTPWPWEDDVGLLFGTSALEGAEKFSRFFVDRSQAELAATLRRWKEYWPAGWFDEWIANGDRNLGNLMVVKEGDYRLIDHDQAFGGPLWAVMGLDCTEAHANVVLDLGAQDSAQYRADGRRSFNRAAQAFGAIIVEQAVADIPFLDENRKAMVAEYLTLRLQCMPRLVWQRLQDNQTPLPLTSPASPRRPHFPDTPGNCS